MNIEEMREYCLSIKGSSESLPFIGHSVLVFKVMGKMFAYIDLKPKDWSFNVCLKCNPDKSIALREQFRGVTATAFNTLLWNSVYLESDVSNQLIKELIDHSVDEVINKLTRKKQEDYRNL